MWSPRQGCAEWLMQEVYRRDFAISGGNNLMKLGVIQGIEIYDKSGTLLIIRENDMDIWFVQEHVRNIKLGKLKERDFKIANVLQQHGYNVSNPTQFDADLKNLSVVEKFYCEVCRHWTHHIVALFHSSSFLQLSSSYRLKETI